MITLSHDLGYRVVAEGVETDAAAETLKGMGAMRRRAISSHARSKPLL
jgi:EAL domain-containing protein (putative c-di-GMP-specific phosphodiesterase class I)